MCSLIPLYDALVCTIVSLHRILSQDPSRRPPRNTMAYLGASDVAWGGWSELDINGYITQMQAERDQDEIPHVHDEWSSEDDITPDVDSGDECPQVPQEEVTSKVTSILVGLVLLRRRRRRSFMNQILIVTVMGKVRVMGQRNQGGRGVVRVVVPVEKGEVEVEVPLRVVVIVTKGGRRIPPLL